MLRKCGTCGKQTERYVEFACPYCGEGKILRCHQCKEIINPYKCQKCGRTGP